MPGRSAAVVVTAVLVLVALAAAPATSAQPGGSPSRKAIRLAAAADAVESHPHRAELVPAAFPGEGSEWRVRWSERGRAVLEVDVDVRSGAVLAVWRDEQVDFPLARGYPGWFGGDATAVWVWLPLSVLFIAPFVDVRRPFRRLHFDLAAVLSLGVSVALFSSADIAWSVAAFYPPLLYLLYRCVRLALWRSASAGPLVPHVPTAVLAVGLVLLCAFRVGFNLVDPGDRYFTGWGTVTSTVTDVGLAGVAGADRVAKGKELYVDNEGHFDTYGPFNYLVYVPFEAIWPYEGVWDDLPAAHAVAIGLDLLVIVLLFVLGVRSRPGPGGRLLAVALAWAWAACPFTLYVLASNTNDAMVAAAVAGALALLARPVAGAAVLALGAAAKFAPAVLLPLVARGRGGVSTRTVVAAAGTFVLVFAALVAPFVPDGGMREIYDVTLGFQASERSPLTVWGRNPGLDALHTAAIAMVALAAAGCVLWRGPREDWQAAALAAALVIALELVAMHWIHFYVVWFLPALLYALFASPRPVAGARLDSASG